MTKLRCTTGASQALEVESDQYSTLLVTVLLNKVPRELWLIIGRQFNSDSRNLDELLKCESEVESRGRCILMATSHSSNSKRKGSSMHSLITAQTLLSPEKLGVTCTFCKKGHRSVDCQG